MKEDLRKWFGKGKKGDWVRVGTDGEIKGQCAREPGEGKPKCMPRDKAHSMSKKDRASSARRKRRADPVVDRPGTGNKPIMVKTDKKEMNEKNVPTNPKLWAKFKAQAKSKFDVYPSAYANGWAAKQYKAAGGGWKTESVQEMKTFHNMRENLQEKSVSQAQQKMMGMALAYKRGEMDDASPEVKKMADSMSMKDLEDFAKTKHKGLPAKKESVDLEEKRTVNVIGGTSAKGGELFMGTKGIDKMIELSKKNPKIEYTVKSDNYGNFKPHWLRNGKFAKQTVANIEFDMDKNAVRGKPKGKDVNDTIFSLSYVMKESVEEADSWMKDSGWRKAQKMRKDRYGNTVKDKNIAKNLAKSAQKQTAKEDVALDELSIDKLRAYRKKAVDDVASGKKTDKRTTGVAKASNKIYRKEFDALYKKESVEQIDEISAKLARKAAAASDAKAYDYSSSAYDDETQKYADHLSNKADKALAHVKKRQGDKGIRKTNRLSNKLIYGKSRYSESVEVDEAKGTGVKKFVKGMRVAKTSNPDMKGTVIKGGDNLKNAVEVEWDSGTTTLASGKYLTSIKKNESVELGEAKTVYLKKTKKLQGGGFTWIAQDEDDVISGKSSYDSKQAGMADLKKRGYKVQVMESFDLGEEMLNEGTVLNTIMLALGLSAVVSPVAFVIPAFLDEIAKNAEEKVRKKLNKISDKLDRDEKLSREDVGVIKDFISNNKRASLRLWNRHIEQMKRMANKTKTESVDLGEAYKTPAEAGAFEDGKKAARKGKKYEDNPHKKGTNLHLWWSKGHNKVRESVELGEAKISVGDRVTLQPNKNTLDRSLIGKAGVVTGMVGSKPTVKFANGKTIAVSPKDLTINESVELDEASLASKWQSGAKVVKKGKVELTRGSGGVHSIKVNGKSVGDFSLDDDSGMWVTNVKGKKGQGTYDEIDDIVNAMMKESVELDERVGGFGGKQNPNFIRPGTPEAMRDWIKRSDEHSKDKKWASKYRFNSKDYFAKDFSLTDKEASTINAYLSNNKVPEIEKKETIWKINSKYVPDDTKRKMIASLGKSKNGMKESVQHTFFTLREARRDAAKDLYFDTYSAAVQTALADVKKKGFEVDEDDWHDSITTGSGKPGRGKTVRHTIGLTKGGKPQRKALHIQVYNRDTDKKTYELNYYVS